MIILRILIASLFIGLGFGIASSQVQTGTVTTTRANLRETPSQSGEVKREVPIGSEIKILDRKGAWYVVRIADTVGWMHGNTFRFEDPQVNETRTVEPQRPAPPRITPPQRNVETNPNTSSSVPITSEGLIRGPRGGCYHYSKSGKKVYVDRSRCL